MTSTDLPLTPSEIRAFNAPGSALAERLLPFLRTIRGYRGTYARRDLVAGLTVALFTIPQGMAYSLIAGFPPQAGIITSVAASILGAVFGSSEFLINGPTNAISVMIAANAALFAAHGDPVQMIILLTLMIGVAQVVTGALRIGSFTRFVSEPVLIGFTSGAGLYIVINQLPALLGLEKADLVKDIAGWAPPKAAVFDLVRVVLSLSGTKTATLILGVSTFAIVRLLQRLEPRLGRRIPAPFFAVAAITFAGWALGLGEPDSLNRVKIVRDIQPLTRELPGLVMPTLDFGAMQAMAGPMFAIGLMGAVEAIAIGKALAAKAGHHFDASRQLIGEGLCNVGAALVGGFASSGSFSRTAVNFESGAITRMSCVASGVLVLVIVFLFAPVANYIPIAALAGTLVHIGLKLVDVGRLQAVYSTTVGDRVVLVATFATVLLTEHLETALFVGIAVSIGYALLRAEGFKLTVLVEGDGGSFIEAPHMSPADTGDVTVLNLQGELFFAAAEVLEKQLTRMLDDNTRFIVLRVQEAYNMDATTAEAIAHVATQARQRGGRLILCGVRPGMYGTFERAGLLKQIGKDAIFRAEGEILASTRAAAAYAHSLARG